MKIFLCLNHFLPANIAGTEIYTFNLARYLVRNNYAVTVLIPHYGEVTNAEYYYENIRVLQFAEPSIVNRELIMRKVKPIGVSSFSEILENEKPAIIHFHTVSGSNGITMHHVRAAAKLGIKLLFTFHISGYSCTTGTLKLNNQVPCDGYVDPLRCTTCIYQSKGITGIKNRWLTSITALLYKVRYNARSWNNSAGTALGFPFMIEALKKDLEEMATLGEGIIVLTHWYKKVMEINKVPRSKLFYIAQGLPGNPGSIIYNLEDAPAPLRFIYIGRITEDKGLHLIIEALKFFGTKAVYLTICGAPGDLHYYNKLREITKGRDNIYWKGVVEPVEIISEISRHHCLCIPSIICEMSPLVIQEAFAAKVPVLASAVYGNAEQVKDGENGWLFRQGETDDLRKKIELLIEEPQLLSLARKNIVPIRSFESVGQDHDLIYQKITSLAE